MQLHTYSAVECYGRVASSRTAIVTYGRSFNSLISVKAVCGSMITVIRQGALIRGVEDDPT